MTHLCCPPCRLRFPRYADDLAPCPMCGAGTLDLDAELVLGFRRYVADAPESLVAAVALRAPTHVPPVTS